MIPPKTVLERQITGRQYLEEKGLNPKMYFLAVDGKKSDLDTEIKQGSTVQAIPIVKGG